MILLTDRRKFGIGLKPIFFSASRIANETLRFFAEFRGLEEKVLKCSGVFVGPKWSSHLHRKKSSLDVPRLSHLFQKQPGENSATVTTQSNGKTETVRTRDSEIQRV